MTIKEWLDNQTNIPRLDAELILLFILNQRDRSYLVAHSDDTLSSTDISYISQFIERRQAGEPLAYILGFRDFYGRRFKVTKDVLVPRPETEDIIELVKTIKPDKILDVGTGSGCIAVTLKLELPEAEVHALDISPSALRVAQNNAFYLGAKVKFHQSDLLNNYKPEPDTLIIANLPYVDENWDWLDKKVLDFEPSIALYAEQKGLALIYKLIDQAPAGCSLILEADPCQHEAIIAYAAEHGRKLKKQQNFILYFA